MDGLVENFRCMSCLRNFNGAATRLKFQLAQVWVTLRFALVSLRRLVIDVLAYLGIQAHHAESMCLVSHKTSKVANPIC